MLGKMKDIEVGKGRVLQVKWGWSWDAEGNLMSVQLTHVRCAVHLLLSALCSGEE